MAQTVEVTIASERIAAICRQYGIARLAVFGSVARGEATDASDVDLLYELLPGRRLGWEIEDLSDEPSVALGRTVDLVSRRSLHPRLRPAALADARLIYAA